jgi:hypothetical protein
MGSRMIPSPDTDGSTASFGANSHIHVIKPGVMFYDITHGEAKSSGNEQCRTIRASSESESVCLLL